MEGVKQYVESLASNILALSERAQAIGEITASVNDIAEQTNVLALNAAVEASRAGESKLSQLTSLVNSFRWPLMNQLAPIVHSRSVLSLRDRLGSMIEIRPTNSSGHSAPRLPTGNLQFHS